MQFEDYRCKGLLENHSSYLNQEKKIYFSTKCIIHYIFNLKMADQFKQLISFKFISIQSPLTTWV